MLFVICFFHHVDIDAEDVEEVELKHVDIAQVQITLASVCLIMLLISVAKHSLTLLFIKGIHTVG